MDKSRLMELAGVEKKPAKVEQLNEMVGAGVIRDAIHDAIWDVLNALKVKAPEHTVNDAIESALHRLQGEMGHVGDGTADDPTHPDRPMWR